VDTHHPTTRERLLDGVRKGAARARELIARLIPSRRSVASTGVLEALLKSLESIESHIATYDLPVDPSELRQKLEALLSILLEVKDDRVAGEAAGPLEGAILSGLPRLEALFLDPEDLYPHLDLSTNALSSVKAALDHRDYSRARTALAARLRTKTLPEPLAGWLTGAVATNEDDAILASRGFLRAKGGLHQFAGSPVDWERAPEFAHRHDEVVALAAEYRRTGGETWSNATAGYVLTWAISVPPPSPRLVSPAWKPSYVAKRLLNWATAYVLIRASRSMTPEFARVFMSLVRESSDYLGGRAGRSKHDPARSLSAAALAAVGTLFDELESSESFLAEASGLFAERAETAVFADGGHRSVSLDVHERTLDAFVTGVAALSPTRGKKTREHIAEAAARMLTFQRALILPDGSLPGEGRAQEWFSRCRIDRMEAASRVIGASSDDTSDATFHVFGDSGVCVMRSGAGDEVKYLMIRSSGTREVVVAGSAGPAARIAPAPVCDEAAPEQTTGRPREVTVRAGPPSDYVRIVDEIGDARSMHRRELLAVERRYAVLCDRVQSDEPHEWSLSLDLCGGVSISADGRRVITDQYLVILAGPTDCGFRRVEAPDMDAGVRLRTHTKGTDIRFMLLMYPLLGESPDGITVEPVASGSHAAGFVLRRPGTEDMVCFPHGEQVDLPGVGENLEAVALTRPAGSSTAFLRKLFEIRTGE
jgi:hypothetical protein